MAKETGGIGTTTRPDPARKPKDGKNPDSNRAGYLGNLSGEDNRKLKKEEVHSRDEAVALFKPKLGFQIPLSDPADLDASDSELPVECNMKYGDPDPSTVMTDFTEPSLVWKVRRTEAPKGSTEVDRRPLLRNRMASEAIAALLRQLRTGAQKDWLRDPAKRKALRQQVQEGAEALRRIIAKHRAPKTGERQVDGEE